MPVDLSSFDLSKPDEFIEAADVAAASVRESFGDSFAKSVDGKTYINVDVLLSLSQASVTNALVAGLMGKEEVGVELAKTSITLNALVAEAKASV